MDKTKLNEYQNELNKKIFEEQTKLHETNLIGTNFSRMNLSGANLSGVDLSEANFSGSILSGANFSGANLSGVNFNGAFLYGANLSEADLCGANLSEANFRWADFRLADFYEANLYKADLREADLCGAKLYKAKNIPSYICPINCPQEGSFIGFKQAYSIIDTFKIYKRVIVKLRIPDDAKRSSATTRKCRCDKAEVISITSLDGDTEFEEACSSYDNTFIYKKGEIVSVDNFDEDRWNECSTGIHFFITREEAVNY